MHLEKVAGSRTTALKVRYIITKTIHLSWKNWQNFVVKYSDDVLIIMVSVYFTVPSRAFYVSIKCDDKNTAVQYNTTRLL